MVEQVWLGAIEPNLEVVKLEKMPTCKSFCKDVVNSNCGAQWSFSFSKSAGLGHNQADILDLDLDITLSPPA